MKKSQIAVLILTLGFGAAWLCAQEGQESSRRSAPSGEPLDSFRPPPFHHGHRPPPPPVMVVIDVNHDGKLDAQEIANAAESLRQLDKNGDGELTFEELRPPFPPDFPPRGEFDDGDGPEHDCPDFGDGPPDLGR